MFEIEDFFFFFKVEVLYQKETHYLLKIAIAILATNLILLTRTLVFTHQQPLGLLNAKTDRNKELPR